MISTRNLSGLPDVNTLHRLLQSMAMLDAILSPEWEYRYYSFNAKWSEGEQMGSMRNGSGDDFFALFNSYGCFLKGFDHEAVMSPYRFDPPGVWPGMFEGVPNELSTCLNEPAFTISDTTFCIWRSREDSIWHHGPIDWPNGVDLDGSQELLSPLDGNPETYQQWAEEYYEQSVELSAVQYIYAHLPLTDAVISSLNPEIANAELIEDIQVIGYPKE